MFHRGKTIVYSAFAKDCEIKIKIAAHPDPTLKPGMVKAFAKKLRKQYGWTKEDLTEVTQS
jgi:hypothetical protein